MLALGTLIALVQPGPEPSNLTPGYIYYCHDTININSRGQNGHFYFPAQVVGGFTLSDLVDNSTKVILDGFETKHVTG